MIKVLSTVLTLLMTLVGGSALAAEQTRTLQVDNMTCASCPLTVRMAMSRVDGVIDVDVDLDTKMATVRFDDEATTLETVAKASTDIGFPAHVLADN